MSAYEAVIGLEVHVQLATDTKLFCGCRARPEGGRSVGEEPANVNTCPVCAGHPGTLPVLNRRAVEFAVRAGLATQCWIRPKCVFARKNYFYPDLPKGYQISQYEEPLCEKGSIEIATPAGPRKIRIARIHMEEDAGKNVHYPEHSLVNLNRAGVPLVEIVSEPDLRNPYEAGTYLREIYSIVTYLGICDGNLQEGNFRCDANVSVRRKGEEKLGTRAEIKNVNSFRFVEKAIEHEIARQIAVISAGGTVVQETRLYDPDRNVTASMRGKEEAHDYRYFPDPDLVPLAVDEKWLEEIRGRMPAELPARKRKRYVEELGLSAQDAEVLTGGREAMEAFEDLYRQLRDGGWDAGKAAGQAANVLIQIVLPLKQAIPAAAILRAALERAASGVISSGGLKALVTRAILTGEADVDTIIEREGLKQVSDTGALDAAIDGVLAANPGQVEQFKAGKEKVLGFLVGQTMKATGGKANPQLLNELIRKKLSS